MNPQSLAMAYSLLRQQHHQTLHRPQAWPCGRVGRGRLFRRSASARRASPDEAGWGARAIMLTSSLSRKLRPSNCSSSSQASRALNLCVYHPQSPIEVLPATARMLYSLPWRRPSFLPGHEAVTKLFSQDKHGKGNFDRPKSCPILVPINGHSSGQRGCALPL